jgi:outer membrane protein TolC
MFIRLRVCAPALAAATLLSACRTFSPDGGMETVAYVAGDGLAKDVARIDSPATAGRAQAKVSGLLRAPLSADAAVQVALLNNAGLQAAYNRLGIAEAVTVQASRPPLPAFSLERVSTSVELDIERKVVGSILALAVWPSRKKIAGLRFAQAELVAAEDTLRLAADTRRAYVNAVAAREIAGALGKAKATAEASAELAAQLKETGAINALDLARRQVFATEMAAQVATARQQATAAEERLTRLMGLWDAELARLLPAALPPLPRKSRSVAAVVREAMDRRVDLAVGKLEVEGLAKSYGLMRTTRFINVLDAGGISKTQKEKGERKADGGGFDIAFEIPLYDFGRARKREAEQRYYEALNTLAETAVNARSEAREAYAAYASTHAIALRYQREVLPLRETISAETELQYNTMQVDAFTLLETARANAAAKVASIEAKRNFWIAYTDLSAAVLGGGSVSGSSGLLLASEPASVARH